MHRDTIFTKMTNKVQLCRTVYCSLTVLHVSSDIFAHHQDHLNCNYSFCCCRLLPWQQPTTKHVNKTRSCNYS